VQKCVPQAYHIFTHSVFAAELWRQPLIQRMQILTESVISLISICKKLGFQKVAILYDNHKRNIFLVSAIFGKKICLSKVAITPAYRYFLGSKDICDFLAYL